MFDPYDILGLPRDASKEDIKHQYRALAREKHPDCGGSAEEFELIDQAYRLLMDDNRRAVYDQTGMMPKGDILQGVDPALAKAMKLLSNVLGHVLLELMDKGNAPTEADIVTLMGQQIGTAIAESRKGLRKVEMARAIFALLKGRFVPKEKVEHNYLDYAAANRAPGQEGRRGSGEHAEGPGAAAQVHLQEGRSRSDLARVPGNLLELQGLIQAGRSVGRLGSTVKVQTAWPRLKWRWSRFDQKK